MRSLFFSTTLLFMIFFDSIGFAQPDKPVYTGQYMQSALEDADQALLDLDAFLALRRQVPEMVLLDVRSEERYAEKHIKGAINIPLTELTEETLAEKIPDASTPVAVMCDFSLMPTRLVPMTLQAYPVLKAAGYSKIYRLELWPGKSEGDIEAAIEFDQSKTPTAD